MKHLADCKTEGWAKTFLLAGDLMNRLMAWKQVGQFREADDWIFASPFQLGKLPYATRALGGNSNGQQKRRVFGHISTHSFRHSYRSWLASVATSPDVIKQLMRQRTIAMAFDTYGALLGDEASSATEKMAPLAFHGERSARRSATALRY